MLPGRGTAVELAFYKRFLLLVHNVFHVRPHTARELQLGGLSLSYTTALDAACRLLCCTARMPGLKPEGVQKAQAVVLRVVDSMQPAARSLSDRLPEEVCFTIELQRAFTTDSMLGPAFIASLSAKWTAAEMMQMRRARGLLDITEITERAREEAASKRHVDIAKHGLKHCALPSCDKQEASVGQHKRCSACRSAWYCSSEHAALQWKEHKPVCRATTAAVEGGAARD